uniref:DNA-(apurinic or apyrimidinic site) endonuclease n=1 Tax=Parascaris univalens TaxID=6257 RepID=A0A915B956_PARUN
MARRAKKPTKNSSQEEAIEKTNDKKVAMKKVASKRAPTKVRNQSAITSGQRSSTRTRSKPTKESSMTTADESSMNRKRRGNVEKEVSPKKKIRHIKKQSSTKVDEEDETDNGVEESIDDDTSRPLTIITWNVAGLRALVKKDICDFITSDKVDIVLLQETKCAEIPIGFPVEGFKAFIAVNPEKIGYAGVILLTKKEPIKVETKLENVPEELGVEGRLIVAEYEKFYLINAYVPNSGRGLVNLARRKIWDDFFIDYIKELDASKAVIYAGDLNVAHEEIDLANPKSNRNKTAGFTDQERGDFSRLLQAGFVDVYRSLHPDKTGAYTFWSTMHNARATNIGWRLDYFVVSERLMDKVVKCEINSRVMGSDHCPVTLQIDL